MCVRRANEAAEISENLHCSLLGFWPYHQKGRLHKHSPAVQYWKKVEISFLKTFSPQGASSFLKGLNNSGTYCRNSLHTSCSFTVKHVSSLEIRRVKICNQRRGAAGEPREEEETKYSCRRYWHVLSRCSRHLDLRNNMIF